MGLLERRDRVRAQRGGTGTGRRGHEDGGEGRSRDQFLSGNHQRDSSGKSSFIKVLQMLTRSRGADGPSIPTQLSCGRLQTDVLEEGRQRDGNSQQSGARRTTKRMLSLPVPEFLVQRFSRIYYIISQLWGGEKELAWLRLPLA